MSRETQLNNAAIHNDEIKKIAELYRIIINTKEIGFVADFLFKRTQESEKNLLACSMLADEGVPIALYVCAALKVIKDPKEAASQISSGKGSKQALRICRALAESDIVIAQYLLGHVKCLETKGGQIWFDKVIENFRKEQEKFNQNKKTLNLAEARQEVNKTFVTLGWLAIFMVGREIIETQQKSDDKVRRHIKVVEQFKKWHESSNIENLYDSEVASYLLGLKAANYISTLEEVIIDSAKERKKRKWSIVESRKKRGRGGRRSNGFTPLY